MLINLVKGIFNMERKVFILVHGAWHGAWCWQRVIPYMQQQGHEVVCPDLRVTTNISLEYYVQELGKILESVSTPVILVGHSLGGLIISQAAEYWPTKVKQLIYIAGFVLKNKHSILNTIQQIAIPSLVDTNLIVDQATGMTRLNEAAISACFYNDCSNVDIDWGKAQLVEQPLQPMLDEVQISPEKYGMIPKIYIELLHDNAILPLFQQKMYSTQSNMRVLSMASGHCPFISQPHILANYLLEAAN